MKITTERLTTLSIEAMAIIFSVLLALAVNEWRQSMNDRALVKRVISSLRTEIQQNKEQVQTALLHHEKLIKDIHEIKHIDHLLSIEHAQTNNHSNKLKHIRTQIRNQLEDHGLPLAQKLAMVKTSQNRYLLIFGDTDLVGLAEIGKEKIDVYAPRGIQLKSAFIRNNAWEVAIATQATIHMDYTTVAQMSEIYQRHRRYEETTTAILNMLYTQKFRLPPLEDLLNTEKQLIEKYDQLLKTIDKQGIAP